MLYMEGNGREMPVVIKIGLELGVSSMEKLLVSTRNFEQRGNFDN